ncbi:hypothetical protein CKO31_25955 [Thiohalocapsa halophila]|uniref:Uncharacterized protein n=1 Tax=Thiohalocapsa halophila TaxID=69359 RepID=A0ABS1CQ87_9GAMM|nr:hypothetical protein [Thiohalocapsa halophila]
MDLVGDHKDVMAATDVSYPLQFMLLPDPANRIVGIAEYQQPGPGIGRFLFKVIEVHAVGGSVPK